MQETHKLNYVLLAYLFHWVYFASIVGTKVLGSMPFLSPQFPKKVHNWKSCDKLSLDPCSMNANSKLEFNLHEHLKYYIGHQNEVGSLFIETIDWLACPTVLQLF